MRRSIAVSEPAIAYAGQKRTWKFIYTTATALPKGTKLKFDLLSEGRPTDWELPETDSKKKKNVIYMVTEEGAKAFAKAVIPKNTPVPQFEFELPEDLEAEDSFTIFIGKGPSSSVEDNSAGNTCQCHLQRRRSFYLYIDTKGKGNYGDPEIFTIDVKGAELSHIRAITPSFVVKNKRFDVVLRFEDEFGNFTSNTEEGTLIDLSYNQLRENLSWKLFIPETGYLAIPNLYFNEPGVYRLKLHNTRTGDIFYSAPIKCFSEEAPSLFWGQLHGENEKYDTMEDIEPCLRSLRDEEAMNFFATSNPEPTEETSNDVWKQVVNNVAQFNEEDRFVSMLGFQWQGEDNEEGLRQFIYAKDSKPLLRKKESKNSALKKIYRTHTPKELLAIPCFTGSSLAPFDFKDFNPEFERVVEIYNAWGSSECTAKQGNPFPINSKKKKGATAFDKGTIRHALNQGHRFGFTAGGLDDRFTYENLIDEGQKQYSPGITGIMAPQFSRDALFEALYQRRTFATTGPRMLLGLNLANAPIGSELSTLQKPGLIVNRHISGFAVGTEDLEKIEIIRNGEVLSTFKPDSSEFSFTYDDMDPLGDVVLPPGSNETPFVYYYLRVFQKDGHIAWSSPIWIDFIANESASLLMKSRKKGRK